MGSAGGSGANQSPGTNPAGKRMVFCVKFQREM